MDTLIYGPRGYYGHFALQMDIWNLTITRMDFGRRKKTLEFESGEDSNQHVKKNN